MIQLYKFLNRNEAQQDFENFEFDNTKVLTEQGLKNVFKQLLEDEVIDIQCLEDFGYTKDENIDNFDVNDIVNILEDNGNYNGHIFCIESFSIESDEDRNDVETFHVY